MQRERYVIYHNDKPVSKLNENLLKFKKISIKNENEIISLHEAKLKIYDVIDSTNNKEILRICVKLIEELEYNLQELWGFNRDRNYHRWFEVPKCKCPKLDNLDNIGIDRRIISFDCPLHGE